MPQKPDYGIDAPGVLRNLFVIGGLLLILAPFVPPIKIGQVRFFFSPMFWGTGTVLVIEGILMLIYVKYGKFRHRDRMLSMVPWRGDEQVLDIGTGRGLLLIGAARYLETGKATGIDIWNKEDLSGNSLEKTEENVALEGVTQKVELRSEDARKMSFPDSSFDVVVSNLCIHNIYEREGRVAALREIVRVLKPGGIALISDYKNTREYQKAFSEAGLEARRLGLGLATFPPLRIVEAKKKATIG